MSLLLALLLAPAALAAPCAPDGFQRRGVLEGFYGRPWTWAQRREMVAWMGRRQFNLFIIAPKDDDALRRFWRKPLTREYLEGLRGVVKAGRANAVEIAWELSPGLEFRGVPADIDAAVAKYESVLALGVRQLVLAFDDTPVLEGHIPFANEILKRLSARHADVVMTFVPAEYYGDAAPSRYLKALGARLDPRYLVGWTGSGILSRVITVDDARRWRALARHPLVLGDNYPVEDRLIDAGRLFLGPVGGREAELAGLHEAYVANASPLPEVSKIALQSSAQYACRPSAPPRPNFSPPALAEFVRQNSCSWLRGDFDGECSTLETAIDQYWLGGGAPAPLRNILSQAASLPGRLALEPKLAEELQPWTRKTAAMSRAALSALEIDQVLRSGQKPSEAALRELNARLVEADNPAIVGNLSLERFVGSVLAALNGAPPAPPISLGRASRFFMEGEGTPQAKALLRSVLERAIAGPKLLKNDDAREMAPWILVLADGARDVRAALEPGWRLPAAWRKVLRRWRGLRRALPLIAAREILERFFDETEASFGWETPEAGRPLPRALRAWLAIQRRIAPDSIPVRLSAGPTADTLQRMIDASRKVRRSGGLEEVGPWLFAGENYGRLGLKALELRKRAGSPASGEAAQWKLERQRLLSANGLEMCVELKLLQDALIDWLETPAEARRPIRIKIPSDFSEIL